MPAAPNPGSSILSAITCERLRAFLDDVYAVVEPHHVRPVYDLLAHQLLRAATVANPGFGTKPGTSPRNGGPGSSYMGGGPLCSATYWAHPSAAQSTPRPIFNKCTPSTHLSSSTFPTLMTYWFLVIFAASAHNASHAPTTLDSPIRGAA